MNAWLRGGTAGGLVGWVIGLALLYLFDVTDESWMRVMYVSAGFGYFLLYWLVRRT